MEVDFDSTLGAIYVGVAVTACLCGISTLHGYTYWNHRKQDSAITRISMAVLWLADAAKLVCATHIGYRLLITEYQNDPEELYYTTWSINMELLLTTLIVFVTQVFTAYHAWKSARRTNTIWAMPHVIRVMGIIAVFFAFLQLSFGITMSSLSWVCRDIRQIDKHRWVASVWMGSATFSSMIITYMLSALLFSTYVRSQNIIDLVNEFLRCIVHTAFLTSVLTIVNLIAFSFMGQYISIAVNLPLGTLNLITLFAILNGQPRDTLDTEILGEHVRDLAGQKDRPEDADQISYDDPLRIGKLSLKVPSKLHKTSTSIKVFVQKETHVLSISRINGNHSNSTLKHQNHLNGTESTKIRTDSTKSQTFLT